VGYSQPAGSGCGASTSNTTYYSNGLTKAHDDFNGHRTCYGYTSSSDGVANLEKVRVEGLNGGGSDSACDTVLASGATLPKAADGTQPRKISTKWHPDWALKTQEAEPNLLTTWVYNGQTDPETSQTASCIDMTYSTGSVPTLPDGKPIAVLCKKIEQRTADDTGAQGLSAVQDTSDADATTKRVWTYRYTEFGQMLKSTPPPNYSGDTVDRSTTYAYYPDTAFTGTVPNEVGHTKGDLQTVTVKGAGGQSITTTYNEYDRAGRVLKTTDANDLVTTMSYTPRGWLKSTNQGGLLTQYDYWPTGLLKKATQPDGSYLYYIYDDAHRLTDVTDKVDTAGNPTGNKVHYTLDNAGNRQGEDVRDASGTLTRNITRTYDALNRLQTVQGATQ
jgi:YD repeat-containing protein